MQHHRKLEQMYASAPINATLPTHLTVAEGTADVRIEVLPTYHHSAGALHGSLYFKALDDATFFAANSLDHDHFVLTAKFEIELLAPVSTGTIRAVATVTEQGDRRIVASGELFDGDGTLIARGTGHFARSRIPLSPEVGYRLHDASEEQPQTPISHGFLFVVDLVAMTRFYSEVFGFVIKASSSDGFNRLLHARGAGLALHTVPPKYAPQIAVPPVWREDSAGKLCYRTDDLQALRDRIVGAGGQVKEPWDWEGATFCECCDPEGNVFQVFKEAT